MNVNQTQGHLVIPPPFVPREGPKVDRSITFSASASQAKAALVDFKSFKRFRERGLTADQILTSDGICTLLKKSAGEMASRRFTNLVSHLPGRLGFKGWTGSSHLRGIRELAADFQLIPRHLPQMRLQALEALSTELCQYGAKSAKSRLQPRLDALRLAVQAEIMETRAQIAGSGFGQLSPRLTTASGVISRSGEAFARAVATQDLAALNRWAEDLGTVLGEDLQERGVDPSQLASSNGSAFKEELMEHLANHHPGGPGVFTRYATASPEVRDALDRLYATVVNRVQGWTGKVLLDKRLDIDGVIFQPQGGLESRESKTSEGGAMLDSGGYGTVYVYEDAAGNKMVVKEPKLVGGGDPKDVAGLTEREARLHLKAVQGSEHIVGVHAVIHNGYSSSLCIELCELGEVGKVGRALEQTLEGEGSLTGLTPEQRLKVKGLVVATMARDMTMGLAEMHRNGIGHLDYKAGNVFVDKNGVAKSGDLGTAVELADGCFQVKPVNTIPDTYFYMSPELHRTGSEVYARFLPIGNTGRFDRKKTFDLVGLDARIEAINHPLARDEYALIRPRLAEVIAGMQVEGLSDHERASLSDAFEKLIEHVDEVILLVKSDPLSTTEFTLNAEKADVWGLGVSLSTMFYAPSAERRTPFDRGLSLSRGAAQLHGYAESGQSYTEFRTSDWHQDPQNSAKAPPTPNRLLDNFLNRAVHSQPGARATAAGLLEDPFLTQAGVGSDEVRNLVILLLKGTATRAQLEQAALRIAEL